MAQRASGYERVGSDLYQTPAWVVDALAAVIGKFDGDEVWEPACGEGKMAMRLKHHGAKVHATDILDHGFSGQGGQFDFLDVTRPIWAASSRYIITNPPYGKRGALMTAFVRQALADMKQTEAAVAMLLPIDFDSAKGRKDLFGPGSFFVGKIVLTTRIKWFDGPATPSVNHAWFLWGWFPRSVRGAAPALFYDYRGDENGNDEPRRRTRPAGDNPQPE